MSDKWPHGHSEKHREAALLGWERRNGRLHRPTTRNEVREVRRKRETAADKYMNEEVNYGGERMTRAKMIQHLQKVSGGNQKLVDRYLQGHEQASAIERSMGGRPMELWRARDRMQFEAQAAENASKRKSTPPDQRFELSQRAKRLRYRYKMMGANRQGDWQRFNVYD